MAPKRKVVSESEHSKEADTKTVEKRVKSSAAAASESVNAGTGLDSSAAGPLWRRPDPSFESIDTSSQLAQTFLSRHLAFRFQIALRDSKRDVALAAEFANQPMDNSRGWLDGKPNPIKLWAEMEPAFWDFTEHEHRQMQQIFELLLQSGASRWVNEPDSTDGNKRPIDVASPIAAVVLTAYPACDLNPRTGYSLLHRMILSGGQLKHLKAMIDRIDPDMLDWTVSGKTALSLAATMSSTDSPQIEVVSYLLQKIGAVNPYHPSFTPAAISQFPTEVADRIRVARSVWMDYRSDHLPNQISRALPSVLPSLIELIVDYVCSPCGSLHPKTRNNRRSSQTRPH